MSEDYGFEPDDGDDRYDEYKDDVAMGYINEDGSQREPDEPDWGMREGEGDAPATCAAYGTAHDTPVWRPGDPGTAGRFCYACIDRCHEALEFDHRCAVCTDPKPVPPVTGPSWDEEPPW